MTPNRSRAPAARPLTVWLLDAGPLLVGLLLILAKFALLAGRFAEGQGLALLIVLASSFSALLASLLVMLPRLARVAALLVVNLVVATAALADAVHLRVFGNAIALAEVAYAHQLLTVVSSVRQLLQPADALYYLDVLTALVVTPLYVRACPRPVTQAPPACRRRGDPATGRDRVRGAAGEDRRAGRHDLPGGPRPVLSRARARGHRRAPAREGPRLFARAPRPRALAALRSRQQEKRDRDQRGVAQRLPAGARGGRPGDHAALLRLRPGKSVLHRVLRSDRQRRHVGRRVHHAAFAPSGQVRGSSLPLPPD